MITKLEINNSECLTANHEGSIKILGSAGREWQLEALDALAHSQFSVLVCPSGAGKSIVQVGLAIEDIIQSAYSILQLFVVPQTHIAAGFFKSNGAYSTIQIKGKSFQVRINPLHNFCDNSSVKGLINLLLADRSMLAESEELSGLLSITSHQALRFAWSKMSASQRAQAIQNLHLRIDESHHTMMSDEEDHNQIGAICNYMVNSSNETSKITMSTATDFRGDNQHILTPKIKNKFTYYHRDWLEHWNTLGIDHFSIEIQEFDKLPLNQVAKNVCSEKNQYHYIAVPPRNIKWRSRMDDDSHGVDALIAAIKAEWPEARILNLVAQEERKSKKHQLLKEPKIAKDGVPQFDVVITCMLGREGTDWVPCSRLHVTYIEGSITLAVQTVGRMLRTFPDKTNVIARYYYPSPIFAEGVTKEQLLNDRKNALLLMLQWEEEYHPIIFPSKPPHSGTHSKGSLIELVGSKYNQMKSEFIDLAIEDGIMSASATGINAIIAQILQDYHIPADQIENAHDALCTILLRAANPRFRGVNISFVREKGFAQLYESLSKSDKALVFKHDYTNMQQLRQIIKHEWDVVFEQAKNIQTIEELDQHSKLKKWVLAQKKAYDL